MTKNKDSANSLNRLQAENVERVKELAAINKTTYILKENKSIEETLQKICDILPVAWQFPEHAVARIIFDKHEISTRDFVKTQWVQRQPFTTIDNKKGAVEIYYTSKFKDYDEGPFLKEERHLIEIISGLITGFLNSVAGKNVLSRIRGIRTDDDKTDKPAYGDSRQLLQRFLNKSNYDRDVYHDLMPFKVREILLVANLYDAYSIEKEGRFSEHVLGEYHQLNLTAIPRITGVSSREEAMDHLRNKHFDMVILMMGADKHTPIGLSCDIKKEFPYIPVFLLLNNNSDLEYVSKRKATTRHIDQVFVWNGESQVFFAMIKHVEDRINVENDTEIGLVRVILLVEDSPEYYSRYLHLLYNIVLEQTKRIIDDVSTDELYKVLKLRVRPKILLALQYEEAVRIYEKYRDYMLCLITDVKFEKEGKLNEEAGFDLVKYIRASAPDLPVIIQSHDENNAEIAYKFKASFINKNSDTLSQDFRSFITHFLGFGNFIYRNKQGKQIAIAKSLKEFEKHLKVIPDESLLYHARKNHFSLWLMARGEIQAARILNPRKVTDFENPQKIREYLLSIISKFRNEQNKGKIVPFDPAAFDDESTILSLSEGSLGGKGRGVAFINSLIYNYDFSRHIPNINIKAPKTAMIGTEEFEYFISRNKLLDKVLNEQDYTRVKQMFLESRLTDTLVKRLKILLEKIKKPLAIRSSGLFEDSLMQPFAGIFETYLLPNNHPDIQVRLQQVMDAIKLVYASVYSDVARGYVEAIHYKIEEEKMAVVVQEVVGNQFDNYYYPHISGVAQSYNYYPFSHMKPEEGFAIIGLGLGKYVVEGEKAYRFSPKYPELEINSPKDQFKNSQVEFYAVDLGKKDLNLMEGDIAGLARLDIDDAERQGTLQHCASVYDPNNRTIVPGLTANGPRIVNFADILKYKYAPLTDAIEMVLDVVKEALGSPVEIEFALDLNKDKNYKSSFYLLQLKPLIGSASDHSVNLDKIDKEDILLFSERGMG
ncbi:MAG: PEP/pyruvate-binding domain-containing protein, partial [Bacteroidota bacterium]|nr:PEP/pyruvate-binding domain-containing protein [Bacteroidota bacterium]